MSILENLDIVQLLLIAISLISIIFSMYNVNLIRIYLQKLKEKSKLSVALKYVKYFLVTFIIANILLYLEDTLSTLQFISYVNLSTLFNDLLYLIISFSAFSTIYFIYHVHTNDISKNPLLSKIEYRLYMLGGIFGLLFLYLLYANIVGLQVTRFLSMYAIILVLAINYFVYKIYNLPASISAQNIDNDLSLLAVVLDIYVLVFYISVFVFPRITTNYINYSPVFFFFVNLMISALSKKNIREQDRASRQAEKTENVLYVNYTLDNICPALESVTGLLLVSRKNPEELEELGMFKDIANKQFIWLSEASNINYAVNPNEIEKILFRVTEFIDSSYQVPAIVFDDVGYVKDFNGFKKTVRLIQDIRDHCQCNRVMFMCNIPSVSFDSCELSYFVKDFNIINQKENNKDTKKAKK